MRGTRRCWPWSAEKGPLEVFGRRRIKYAAQILRGGSRKGGILVHANFEENRWPPK